MVREGRLLLVLGLWLCVPGIVACGDDPKPLGGSDAGADANGDGGGDMGGDGGTLLPVYSCVPDLDLLEVPADCVLDEDCACGAHCRLGECAYDCLGDEDCADTEICDAFGRCRDPNDNTLVGAWDVADECLLETEPSYLSYWTEDAVHAVRLQAAVRDSGPVRVTAPDGLSVRCAAGDSFASECTFANIPLEDLTPHAVEVRLDADLTTEAQLHEVGLFCGNQRSVISVQVAALPEPSLKSGGEEITPGEYSGYAWPQGLGLASRSMGEISEDLARLRLAVTVRIFTADGDTQTVGFADTHQALFPDDETVAVLGLGDAWDLDIPARLLIDTADLTLEGAPVDLHDIEVVVSYEVEELEQVDDTLFLTLLATYTGATLPAYAPQIRWQMALNFVGDLPEGVEVPTPSSDYTPTFDLDTDEPARVTGKLDEEWTTELGDNPTTRQITETYLCMPGLSGEPEQLVSDIATVDGSEAKNGDLACSSDGGNIVQQVLHLNNTETFDVGQTFDTCLSDLELGGAGSSCVSRSRFLTALNYALEIDRDRVLGDDADADIEASALAHRLLQQWLHLNGFLARESVSLQEVQDIASELFVREADYAGTETMVRSIAGWDVFLHPRFGAGLPVLPSSMLVAPDYREILFPDEFPDDREDDPLTHDQGVGLPVVMLDTLTVQIATLDKLVERARLGLLEEEEVEALNTALMRRSLVITSFAQGLYDNARSFRPPEWRDAWQPAQAELVTALERLGRQLEAMRAGENALGIEDRDLPLYRIGEQEGAISRFSALSDYLLGSGQDQTAIAPALVIRATESQTAAREALVELLQRDLAADLAEDEHERRIEAITAHYGGQVMSLCGDVGASDDDPDTPPWTPETVMERWNRTEPDTCFISPTCRFNDQELADRITVADLGFELCLVNKLRQRFGDAVTTGNASLDRTIDELGGLVTEPDDPFDFSIEGDNFGEWVLDFGGDVGEMFLDMYGCPFELEVRLPEGAPPEYLQQAIGSCESARQATIAVRPTLPPDSCQRIDDCPLGYDCIHDDDDDDTPGACQPDIAADENQARPECYSGALGEMALSMLASARNIDVARAEMAELSDRYDIAMRSCMIEQLGNQAAEMHLADHNDTMNRLAAVKLAADVVAVNARAVRNAAGSGITGPFRTAVRMASAAVEAGAESVSLQTEAQMERVERAHEELMVRLENEIEEKVCFNDAELHLVGTSTAVLRIQQANLELARQMVEFENQKDLVRRLLIEGHAALEREGARRVNPMGGNFWFHDDVARHVNHMRQARRATYLAVRAVEYEFQFTSELRSAVIEARLPTELEDVLDSLRNIANTGTVSGASPSDLFEVVSMRQNLLQMADRSEFPEGWHTLTEQERFRALVTSPSRAVYTDDGTYLGQEVRFAIYPLGVDGLGEYDGIPLLAGTDCAERLWSVNASLLGTDLYRGSDTTRARIVLRKRNTFFSQWCDSGDRETLLQVASTRPSRNLFLDPLSFADSRVEATPGTPNAGEETGFTAARIQAFFNVERAALEDEAYFNGDSQELAGRGLYGDYALFFPAETLSRDGADGLVLDHIEDVLLRLDYVSVAR